MSTYGTLTTNTETTTHLSETENFARAGRGSKVRFLATGTFGAGTLTLQCMCADGTWRDMPDGALTANADKEISVTSGTSLRASLSGSTGASIYYEFTNLN